MLRVHTLGHANDTLSGQGTTHADADKRGPPGTAQMRDRGAGNRCNGEITGMYETRARCTAWLWMVALLLPLGATAADCEPWVGRLTSLQGSVDVQRYHNAQWQAAELGQTYCLGDRIRVGADARASVELSNDTVLRLDQRSTLVFPEPSADSGFSFVELLEGALHLMSRIRGQLEIRTPFVNAGLEGTEFVVRIDTSQTRVLVIEGTVRVSNSYGTLHISDGQAASASAGSAPVLRLDLQPSDAIQWALFYPLTIDAASDDIHVTAQRLLRTGRVADAEGLLRDHLRSQPDDSRTLALASIVALAQNRHAQALDLAQRAVAAEPSAAALMALSYAHQAAFDLAGARAVMLDATTRYADDALLWSRLAETHAALGLHDAARRAAQRAVELDPALSRTQTVLGFAHLNTHALQAAHTAFERAIERDSSDPLPRLGIGLARIAGGELAAGRREIEVAVSLDPDNALVRSYLGRAYAAEGRDDEAATQLRLARQFDPLDPTPWLYDALRKQADARPIEAILDYERSVALNDKRAVLRSRLTLDDDLALRHAAIGATYASLGLRSLGKRHAARALAANPGNADVHALIADLARDQPRLGMARISERLQAQMLQPLAAAPVSASEYLLERERTVRATHYTTGSSDYSGLFDARPPRLQASVLAGSDNAFGSDVLYAGRIDRLAYDLGYFRFDTDGFREGADVRDEGRNGFIQLSLNEALALQLEARHTEKHHGDLRLGLHPLGAPDRERRSMQSDVLRAGARVRLGDRSVLLLSVAQESRSENESRVGAVTSRTIDDDLDATIGEVQWQHRREQVQLIVGGGVRDIDRDRYQEFNILFPFPFSIPLRTEDDIKSKSLYTYLNWFPSDDLTFTLGASRDSHEDSNAGNEIIFHRVNPKLGLQWQLSPAANLRAVYLETTKHPLVAEATLEPTQVAGFTQMYDDPNQTISRLQGVGIDLGLGERLAITVEQTERKTDFVAVNQYFTEKHLHAVMTAILGTQWTASVGYDRVHDHVVDALGFELETTTYPITVSYRSPAGYFADIAWTTFDQHWQPVGTPAVDTRFDALNLSGGYRWNRGRYQIRFGVDDLLDDVEEYRDDRHKVNDQLNVYRPFIPGRSIWGSIAIAWD